MGLLLKQRNQDHTRSPNIFCEGITWLEIIERGDEEDCNSWKNGIWNRSHKRNKDFYAKKIPCNIFMMNDDGRVDMIKSRQMSHNGESISTELALSTPQMTVSEESKDTNKWREDMDDKTSTLFVRKALVTHRLYTPPEAWQLPVKGVRT